MTAGKGRIEAGSAVATGTAGAAGGADAGDGADAAETGIADITDKAAEGICPLRSMHRRRVSARIAVATTTAAANATGVQAPRRNRVKKRSSCRASRWRSTGRGQHPRL